MPFRSGLSDKICQHHVLNVADQQPLLAEDGFPKGRAEGDSTETWERGSAAGFDGSDSACGTAGAGQALYQHDGSAKRSTFHLHPMHDHGQEVLFGEVE